MQDAATILEEILNEADALIRQRLKDRGLELPHLVIAVTPDGQVVPRSNVSADVLRSFGEDLKNVADELEAPPSFGRPMSRSIFPDYVAIGRAACLTHRLLCDFGDDFLRLLAGPTLWCYRHWTGLMGVGSFGLGWPVEADLGDQNVRRV